MKFRIIFGSLIFLAASAAAGTVFVKYDTQAAAEFTDNVLRPLLGANNVIFMEKVFFNTSDKVRQITYNKNKIQGPIFGNFTQTDHEQAKGLDLASIPTNPDLNKLNEEGVWKIMTADTSTADGIMAVTFVRPDVSRPYAVVTLVQIDMSKVNLGTVAGTKEPGGKLGNTGTGKVPQEIIDSNRLLAAFDGGFQYRDGKYGMIVGDKTYLPLENNLGTVIGYKNGAVKIINYHGENLGNNVDFVRQNCPILIENGKSGVENIESKALWGRTPTSSIYTWRTGMGLTKRGNLIFAVGNSLTPETLAKALIMGGAKNAIQLDINPNWVRFNIFSPLGNGKYSSKPLTRDLKDGAASYLTGYVKDFFYVYKKS